MISKCDFAHYNHTDTLRSLMHLPIIAAYAIMYTVYSAKLYTAQTNAITNNAAGARLYLTHIVSVPVIAVPSISLFLVIAVRKQMPKLGGNAHGNVSVSVN